MYQITVNLMLFNRVIETGRDLNSQTCKAAVRDHYERHAASDDELLTNYARALEAALNVLPVTEWTEGSHLLDNSPTQIEQKVQDVVNRGLPAFDAARALLPDAVDNPDEIKKLAGACSQG